MTNPKRGSTWTRVTVSLTRPRPKVSSHLIGVFGGEVLHWGDNALRDQLTVRRRGLLLNQLRLMSADRRKHTAGRAHVWTLAFKPPPFFFFLSIKILCILAQQRLPVLPGPERVQLTGAAHGDDQQQPAHQAAHRGRRDDLPGQDDGAVELVRAVLAVCLAVAAPALKHAPETGPQWNAVSRCWRRGPLA